jgi:serine phosphatase RsbU (regulator of sigma subunit)
MDMALCVLDLANTKMQFSGANNGLLHVRGTTLTEYKPVKNPIAIYPKLRPFEDCDVDIQSGDYVYMYSDGYADQFSDAHQKLTNFRFRQLMVDINTKTKSAAGQCRISILPGMNADDPWSRLLERCFFCLLNRMAFGII